MVLSLNKARNLYKGAEICEGAVIREGAVIGKNRKTVDKNMVILWVGSTKNITGYMCDDGVIVNIGCQNEWSGRSIEEIKIEIAKKYQPDHIYFNAIDLIEKFFK